MTEQLMGMTAQDASDAVDKVGAALAKPSASKPEPKPVRTAASREVWPLVIADFKRRDEFSSAPAVAKAVVYDMEQRNATGCAEYGTALHTHNQRNALVDAYQELLDAAVYLKQRLEELRDQHASEARNEWPAASSAYVKTLRLLVLLRPLLPGFPAPGGVEHNRPATPSDVAEAMERR